jgi:hypothetical protein
MGKTPIEALSSTRAMGAEGKVWIALAPWLSMERVDVRAGFRSLAQSLRRIRSLLAWQQLAEAERRGPPSFQIDHHTEDDLRAECGFFLKTAMEIREALAREGKAHLPEGPKARWRSRLLKLRSEFARLHPGGSLPGS